MPQDYRAASLPPVDELRLREIASMWKACREEQAAVVSVAYSGDYSELLETVREADDQLAPFLETMVPELIAELRRRLGES